MPAFTARITAGATLVPWLDPATGSVPSRLNPLAAHGHKRHVVNPLAALVIKATLAGVEGPLDATLGGKLFLWSWVDLPTPLSISTLPTAGQSSVLVFPTSALTVPGHYSILCWRDESGGVVIPWDVDP